MRNRRITAERLGAFSDAVIAVIITVMVLELKPPDGSGFSALLPLWPTVVSYAVSYLFIAVIWVNHHYLLHLVNYPTPRLIWINFAHLFVVSLLPFATAWMARSHLASAPVTIYGAIFLSVDLAYFIFEREVLAQADPSVMPELARKRARRRTFAALTIFVCATAIAPFVPFLGFALICCALVLYLRPEAITGRTAHLRHGLDRDAS